MDPVTLVVGAGTYVAAAAARHVADDALQTVWKWIKESLMEQLGREPTPEDATPAALQELTGKQPLLRQELASLWGQSTVLRRVRAVKATLDGARILWIDDHPEGNLLERSLLTSLAAKVAVATSTDAAIALLRTQRFDLILSDIDRGGSDSAGTDALPQLHHAAPKVPVVFYVTRIDPSRGVPLGSFGITARPDELLHLCMDVLGRARP